ncbi:hypothetical protein BpHYR1_042618 [Brachionus plicatilis]|uniref:Uncharacterized protein n=1 Tax=Brachionus plicatilis TaxID=10195 RepID=A0A3M7QPL0_BRAPC|nr:hypothetical protein BpHYR1_042618 [Brachionus plicatilis]
MDDDDDEENYLCTQQQQQQLEKKACKNIFDLTKSVRKTKANLCGILITQNSKQDDKLSPNIFFSSVVAYLKNSDADTLANL